MALLTLPEPDRSQYQSEFLQKNPTVGGPLRSLLNLQSRYLALDRQFQDDMWKLEQEHYNRCQNLFRDRGAIISGDKEKAVYSADGGKASPAQAAGVPHFWLRAMKNNPRIAKWIHARDEPVLSFLRDIRVKFINKDATGFRILFDFDENPFFTCKTLTKEFIYEREPDQDDIYGELVCTKAPGCQIDWHPRRDPTEICQVAPGQFEYESFFDFFQSASRERDIDVEGDGGGDDDNSDGDYDEPRGRYRPNYTAASVHDGRASYSDTLVKFVGAKESGDDGDNDELDSALDCDLDLGEEIKDGLIPYAVHWYTGEAILFEDEDEENGEDEDDEELEA